MLSRRRRLAMVSVLAAVAGGASLASIAWLARTRADQRTARAEERVVHETERLIETGARPPPRAFRAIRSGVLDVAGEEVTAGPRLPPAARAARDAAWAEARATGGRALRQMDLRGPLRRRRRADGDDAGGRLVIAVAPSPRGGRVWAATFVPQPRGERLWRLAAGRLALASLSQVAVSRYIVAALRRGAATLDATLRALARDLDAGTARPAVAELAAVAVEIAALAALERRMIEHALAKSGGNRAEAARALGIARPRLYAKVEAHGIAGRAKD